MSVAALERRFDQLRQSPCGNEQLGCFIARFLCWLERIGITTKTVVEDGQPPAGPLNRHALPDVAHLLDHETRQLEILVLPTLESGKEDRAVWSDPSARCAAHRVCLRNHRAGGVELAAADVTYDLAVYLDRQRLQRACVPGDADLASVNRAPCVVVPKRCGGRYGKPGPTDAFLNRGTRAAGKRTDSASQRRSCGNAPLGHQQRESIQ